MPGVLLAQLALYVLAIGLLYGGSRLALAAGPPNSELEHDHDYDEEEPEYTHHDDLRSVAVWRGILGKGLLIALIAAVALGGLVLLARIDGLRYLYGVLAVIMASGAAANYGNGRLGRLLIAVPVLAMAVLWYCYPSWLTANLLAVLMVIYFIIAFQPQMSFVRAAFIGIFVAVAYDAVQVFGTGAMLQLANAGIEASLPSLLSFPGKLSLNADPVVLLGLGDIGGPGILVVLAGRVSQQTGCKAIYRAAAWAFAGGLLLAFLAASLLGVAQPALIYLFPAITIAVWWTARKHGLMSALKQGPSLYNEVPVADKAAA